MKNKNFLKYKNLDEQYFSVDCPFTFEFKFEGKEYVIDWDWKENKGYYFFEAYKDEECKTLYKTIYDALDKIKFHNKSLRKLLLETDFDFDSIS